LLFKQITKNIPRESKHKEDNNNLLSDEVGGDDSEFLEQRENKLLEVTDSW